jgi:tetratricopeptide (TPR) repeat protein
MLRGGEKKEGLARMLRARSNGDLLRGEADYQLQIIYLWYEKRTDLAVDLLTSLHERYPGNPLFSFELADVHDRYRHDITATLATWRSLLAATRAGRVNQPHLAETRARLGVARQLEALHESDDALEELRTVIAAKPAPASRWIAAAYLALGEAEDRLGHREAAIAAYRRAAEQSPPGDPQEIGRRAAERIRRAPNAQHAEAYRQSLEGLRRLEKGDLTGAESALARSLALDPRAPVARYRYARVLIAKKEEAAALAQLEAVIDEARECPAPIAGAAYLEAARLHERLAHRDKAIDYYRIASTWFGGAADTHASAKRALARFTSSR